MLIPKTAEDLFQTHASYLQVFKEIKRIIGLDSFSHNNIDLLLDLLFEFANQSIEEVPKNYQILSQNIINANKSLQTVPKILLITRDQLNYYQIYLMKR